jgi:cytochrome c556
MKATLQAYLRTGDYKRLESSFKTLATRAPAGFERWGEMADSGAQGAARGDGAVVRKSCQDCHDSYRAQFREKYRGIDLL